MLLEAATDEPVNTGYIHLYSTDTRYAVRITPEHRDAVHEVIDRIHAMSADDIPPLIENRSKCDACSARTYCMPGEMAVLEPGVAEGTDWEGVVPEEPS